MNALNVWPGKAGDLSISYEAGIQQNQLVMMGGAPFGDNLPAIAYSEIDNIRDVADVTWEKTVSKTDWMQKLCVFSLRPK